MIHEFDSIEELNDYYIGLLAGLGQVTMQIGTSADEVMRKGLLKTYAKHLELVHFNDDYEVALRKKQLKRYRKSLKVNDDFSKMKLNVSISQDKKRNRLIVKDLKKSNSLMEKSSSDNQTDEVSPGSADSSASE